jgi:hypothetical protein
VGPAGGYVEKRAGWTLGFFAQTYFSIVGPSSYAPVGKTQIAPAVKFDLRNNWSFGLSTMQFTYDWVRNGWTDVPVGVRIGKKPFARLERLDAYIEFERNLAHAPDTPGWTIRTLIRWRFSDRTRAPEDDDQDQ